MVCSCSAPDVQEETLKEKKEKRHAKHCGERDAKSAVHKGSGQGRVHQAKRGLDHAGRQPPLIPGGATMHQTDSKPPRCLVARLPQVEGWQRTATVVVLDGLSDCLGGKIGVDCPQSQPTVVTRELVQTEHPFHGADQFSVPRREQKNNPRRKAFLPVGQS